MKKLVSIKGFVDNIRQSVNTPSPPGMSGPQGPARLEQDLLETLSTDQFTLEDTVRGKKNELEEGGGQGEIDLSAAVEGAEEVL